MAGKTREEDFIEHLFIASTHHTLLFFTENGRCFWLKVYKIPEGDRNTKGRAIQNLIQIPTDDKIRTIIDEEMEQIWNGKKTAKEGLDSAVSRGNEQLERFEKANKSPA